MNRLIALCICVLAVSACDFQASPPKSIRLANAANITRVDTQVIVKRLNEYTSAGAFEAEPKYSFQADGSDLQIHATSAPSDSDLRYLLSHRGLFQVSAESGVFWFNQAHVADAQASSNAEGRPLLRLKLNAEGAARVARLSATSDPQVLAVMLDGESLTKVRLAGAIPDGALQISIGRPAEEVRLIAAILRSGALSLQPGRVDFMATPGKP